MARRCTACPYTTDDPFQNRCPACDGYLAIACRATQRERAKPFRVVGGSPWAVPRSPLVRLSGIAAIVLIPLAIWLASRPDRPFGRTQSATAESTKPSGRVSIGMPIRQAVLALEPEASTDNRVSLHDLLAPDAPTSGRFTWTDETRMLSVSFRRGKVTSVHESVLPYPSPRQVSIDVTDNAEPDRSTNDGDDDRPIGRTARKKSNP